MEYLWFAVVFGGPIVLGAILAFGMMKRRRLTEREKQASKEATRKLYRSDD
ncbi:hypothetical protein SAMN05428967_0241 [Phyllobacterium sp. YR620]|jgi:hypothetical protein|uniref:hypothetical protein n=1 Tax=unclassified Phyllobacterium TaxID=2638441 RepID=UPI000891C16B|nr:MULTISPECIES: hypothetical protein [unclassified Phyllobacterium]SDO83003.1 hypothetical protein SAMN05428967_0241 [Phyllobacterium sp. YR620]SFJ35118.1 hypothetical protein SAMN04515648_3651 [Phyllobacterium sp. CL33Tsu]